MATEVSPAIPACAVGEQPHFTVSGETVNTQRLRPAVVFEPDDHKKFAPNRSDYE
jgi:hypothetical protein